MIRINGGQATLGGNTFTGAQVAPSLALGGATIGSNALAVTGTATFSSTVYVTGFAAALRLGDAASNAYLNINRDAPTGEFFYDSAQTTFAGHRFKVTGTNVLSVLGGSVIVAQPLVFGGTTSSFPAIKRNATALNFRLADDSADAPITAGAGTFSGALTVPGVTTAALTSTGTFTSGAAAQVGTLTNAPAAGNPTTWIKIIDNGVTRYIPAW